jgi:hypothetical protein
VQGEQLRVQDEQLRVQRSAETEQQRVQDQQLRAQLKAQDEQLTAQRQQLRAAVWPHLQLWSSTVRPGWYITNVGTGPAIITGTRVAVDDKPVKSWEAFGKAAEFTGEDGVASSTIDGLVLPPDKDYPVLQPGESKPGRRKFDELLRHTKHHVTMAVCYCSILKECWISDPAKDRRERQADVCPIPEPERFKD